MDANHIREFFDYNRWANARVLSAAAKLSDADFVKDLGSSFPSVRDTLAHILGAEWVWLQRWRGTSPGALLFAGESPSLAELRSRWAEVEVGQRAILGDLRADVLDQPVDYVNLKGEKHAYPLGHLMVHVVNHSTYHRGQVITLLRQLKAEAASTDYVLYLGQKK